jgi:DNA-binding beta-propeller fold protein YncE
MKLFSTAIAFAAMAAATSLRAAPDYILSRSVPLGAPDHWDYIVFDPASSRVYIAHGDQVAVVDGRSGVMIGRVEGVTGSTHGTAISALTGQGFTDDGRTGTAVAFDLNSLKIIKQIPTDKDADAAVIDNATAHVFVIEGDPGAIAVIDAKTDASVATIKAGEKLEYAAADDAGTVYVAGEEKSDLLKIDARTNSVVGRWPTPDCSSPHGLALDKAARRLFMGCVNSVMMVADADTGRVVAKLPIGRGSDAVAWDPTRRRVFSSNGAEGTITVYEQKSPNVYHPLETITTIVSGRTMAVDPASGRLFVAAADTDPSATRGGRPRTRPGTLRLMFFDPVK